MNRVDTAAARAADTGTPPDPRPRVLGARVVLTLLVTTQLLPFAALRVAALGIGLVWVIHRLVSYLHRSEDRNGILLPALPTFALIVVVVSPMWSRLPVVSLALAGQVFALTVLAVQILTDLSWQQIQRTFAVGLGLLVLLTLATDPFGVELFTVERGNGFRAWQGPFANPNLLAYCCVLAVLTFLTLPPDSGWLLGGWRRWAWLTAALFTLTQTASEGGYVYVTVGVLAVVAAWVLARTTRSVRVLFVVGGVVVMLFGAPWFVRRVGRLVGLDDNPTLTGRTDIWEVGIAASAQAPWAGYGLGSLRDPEAANISSAMTHIWAQLELAGFNSHNGYLDAALQIGIPATAALSVAVALSGARYLHGYWSGERECLWPFVMATVLLAYNMTEVRLLSPALAFLIVALLVMRSSPGTGAYSQKLPTRP